ncbi:MAG: protein-glutamate O-methyltransferase CheR [Magnetococcales bacterium]|nr:protein-glutamate O-methyltransferase CheR [Magnetococcales bacterium]
MAIAVEQLQQIRQFMNDCSGVDIPLDKAYLVESRLTPLLAQHHCRDFVQLCDKLARNSQGLRTQVVDALTTQETLWFRDQSFFDALSGEVLPALLAKARRQERVRIWSAATATGQEIYSVTMLLDAVGRQQDSGFNFNWFTILGSDISQAALAIAKRGHYNHLAMSRGMRPEFLERYFTRKEGGFEVVPAIRDVVKFQQFNLRGGVPIAPDPFDLILCRNVLIYFPETLKQQICRQLATALKKPSGFMAVGAAESLRGLETNLVPVTVGKAVFYRAA